MKKSFSFISNLQTHYFKLNFQKVDQHTAGESGYSMAPNTTRTTSCKAWNSPVEYPSRESKHDIKDSKINMSNPIFKGSIPEQKPPGRCAFVEPELLRCTKPKHIVKNKR